MPVEFEINNRGGKLTPGSFSEVMWPVRRPAASLMVPSSAIVTNLERTFVVRVRNGKVECVDVRPGASTGTNTEVFGDLQPGDQVVVRGNGRIGARHSSEGPASCKRLAWPVIARGIIGLLLSPASNLLLPVNPSSTSRVG